MTYIAANIVQRVDVDASLFISFKINTVDGHKIDFTVILASVLFCCKVTLQIIRFPAIKYRYKSKTLTIKNSHSTTQLQQRLERNS